MSKDAAGSPAGKLAYDTAMPDEVHPGAIGDAHGHRLGTASGGHVALPKPAIALLLCQKLLARKPGFQEAHCG